MQKSILLVGKPPIVPFLREQQFVSPGTYEFVVPRGVKEVKALVIGAGCLAERYNSSAGNLGGRGGGVISGVIPVKGGDAFTVTVGSIAGFLFFLICGALLTYSLFLLPHLLVFWTTATNGIADLTAAVWDFNNMPQLIYGKWMQRIGTFLLPLFVITNFPGLFLMGELSAPMAVWGVAAPIVFFLIARAVWNQAVKNYTSAST